MTASRDIEGDLGYVREVVDRSETTDAGPRAIWFLWGAIAAVGFSLVDVRLAWVPAFWTVAAPGGFLVSAWLGWRYGRALGQESRREGLRHMLHWGAAMVACFLLVPLAARGALSGEALAAAILVVMALAYFLAGVHLARPLMWVGLVIVAGYLAVLYLEGPVWTAAGILVGLALVATGLVTGRSRA